MRGDALQLQGSHSFFIAETIEPELVERLRQQDVHPTGPLYGRGVNSVQADCLQLETEILAEYPDWLEGLKAAGLKKLWLPCNCRASPLITWFQLPAATRCDNTWLNRKERTDESARPRFVRVIRRFGCLNNCSAVCKLLPSRPKRCAPK